MLEGRHVIGLFFLMLLFSGVFFTLGYVMGRNQIEGQVRAEGPSKQSDFVVNSRPDVGSKKKEIPHVEPATDPVPPPSSDWEFYHAGESKVADEHLKPAPVNGNSSKAVANSPAKNFAPAARTAASPTVSRNAPVASQTPRGAFAVQVAAFTKQADAMSVAANLQKKKFPAYVVSPQGDKYYRVQVGPYPTQKAADAARKSIEAAGFKAIVKRG